MATEYLNTSAMRATSCSMALASSVLGFDIVEIWSAEKEEGKLHCTFVHADAKMKERYPGIITGHYPCHKREHKLSPKLCELARRSPTRYHWRILDLPASSYTDSVYDTLAFPLKTEMAYHLQVDPEYGYSAASCFIVAFGVEVVAFKPSKLKFLSGISVAIYVAAFDLDEELPESKDSGQLDEKEFMPRRPHSSLNLAAMDSEGTKPLLTPGPAVVQRPPPLRLETIIERKESADTDVTESYHPPPAVVLPAPPVPTTVVATIPTWEPASPFSFPIANIPIKYNVRTLTFNDFKDIKHIADGSNANIFLAKLNRDQVIIKMIKESAETNKIALQEFDLEFGTLARLDHPSIIKILGAGRAPRRFIVLEYLAGGSLSATLAANTEVPNKLSKLFHKPTFTYTVLLQIAKSMAEGLEYCHHRCHPGATIIHRDLKPDNVGFTKDGALKLFDFGLVTCVKTRSRSSDAYEMTGYTGSLRYMAPEVVLHQPYTEKADVYSFGIMLWQMARDRVPFKGYDRDEFLKQVVYNHERPKLDKSWPGGFSALLRQCWAIEPFLRPSFTTIVMELNKLLAIETGAPLPSPDREKRKGRFISMGEKSHSMSGWF